MGRGRWIANTATGAALLMLGVWLMAELLLLEPARRAEHAQTRRVLAESLGVLIVAGIDRDDPATTERLIRTWARRHRAQGVHRIEIRRADGSEHLNVSASEAGLDDTLGEKIEPTERAGASIEIPILRRGEVWGRAIVRFGPADGSMWTWADPAGDGGVLIALVACGPLVLIAWEWRRRRRGETAPLSATSAEQRARQTLNTLAEGAVVLDLDLRIAFANAAFGRFCAASPSEMIDRHIHELIQATDEHDADGGRAAAPWERALERAQPVHGERLQMVTADAARSCIVNVNPIIGVGGALAGLLATFEDVTELETQRVELARARDQAEHASRVKSSFLANMSHEIRTPLNGVIGTLQLLDDTRLVDPQPKLLGMARVSADTLMCLINDVLDLSKIEAGQLELCDDGFDLRRCIADAFVVLGPKARDKGLAFEWAIDPQIHPHVRGDGDRLRQIVINLLGNAVKFTERGGVRVDVRLDRAEGDAQHVRIEVRDTGIGIPADRMDRLFRPFSQADATTSRRFGGTGLGLAICAEIVRMMGGRIDVRSEPGEGSTFTVALPLRPVESEPAREPPAAAREGAPAPCLPPGLRVLIVEDNAVNQYVAGQMLRHAGVEVRIVETGQRAVEAACGERFDVVLMDCFLPDIDGFEATRRIRAWETEQADGRRVPIVALTAKALSGDREACLEAGMDDYVTKPIDRERLLRTIAGLVSADRASTACGDHTDDVSTAPVGAIGSEAAPECSSAIEVGALLSLCGGDSDVAAHLLGLFEQTCRDTIAALDEQLEAGRADEIALIAHRMKGGAAHAGAARLCAAAQAAESAAEDCSVDALCALADELRAQIRACLADAPDARRRLTRSGDTRPAPVDEAARATSG